MSQLNYTFEMKPEETLLTSNSNDQVITDFDRIINDFTTKLSAGVVDLTLTDELYKLLRLLEANSYKFSNELCDKYIDYFNQILSVLSGREIYTIIADKTKNETSVNLMVSISKNSVKILEYIKDLSNKGINVEEKKTALMAYVKSKMFVGIDKTFLKALEDDIAYEKRQLEQAKKDGRTELISEISKKIDELKQILIYSVTDEGERPPAPPAPREDDEEGAEPYAEEDVDVSYLQEDALIAEEEARALKLKQDYEKTKEDVSKKTREVVREKMEKVAFDKQQKKQEIAFDLFEKMQLNELKKLEEQAEMQRREDEEMTPGALESKDATEVVPAVALKDRRADEKDIEEATKLLSQLEGKHRGLTESIDEKIKEIGAEYEDSKKLFISKKGIPYLKTPVPEVITQENLMELKAHFEAQLARTKDEPTKLISNSKIASIEAVLNSVIEKDRKIKQLMDDQTNNIPVMEELRMRLDRLKEALPMYVVDALPIGGAGGPPKPESEKPSKSAEKIEKIEARISKAKEEIENIRKQKETLKSKEKLNKLNEKLEKLTQDKRIIELTVKSKQEALMRKQQELEELRKQKERRIGIAKGLIVKFENIEDIKDVIFPRDKFKFINTFSNNIEPVKLLLKYSNIDIGINRRIVTTEEARKYLTKAFEALQRDDRFVMADNTTPLFG
jgi:hypothetical protein